ncbi:hypothetical protein PRK78_002290 [Emydomyces testavorans]|uniref:F-box domain-containing protein n=1 Tax=Emydomyces testavorans TaxID=2070801 RepID=A0AAF0DE45_9EURO|nr:hypothetical protein PRK78_002290 [Emydomyces testavorans]
MKRILSKLRGCLRLDRRSTPRRARSPTTIDAGVSKPTAIQGSLVSAMKGSQAESICQSFQTTSPLENLPPELRRLLLSFLDLEALSTLVHASPIFYHQYLADRRYLRRKCLEMTLSSVAFDSCAAYWLDSTDFMSTRSTETVTQFLESYRDRRASTDFWTFIEKPTDDDVSGMITFYSSIIKPLARSYTAWALGNLATETKNSLSREPFSKTEQTRLRRALYRFQICCKLFGQNRHRWINSPRLKPVDILKMFFCVFEPWEVEEIACIYTFAQEKYDQIFHDICWDVHQENPKFANETRPPTPVGAFHLNDSYDRKQLLIGTLSHGLELLHAVHIIRDHEHLVSMMQKHISWPCGYFLEDEALGDGAQTDRRREQPSSRDQKQLQRDPMPFEGDGDLGANEPRPPLAWTLMWGGTYSNLYGYCVPDAIRRWGYVMWDAPRLDRTGAKEVLARQWEDEWGDDEWGEDPRDTLLY